MFPNAIDAIRPLSPTISIKDKQHEEANMGGWTRIWVVVTVVVAAISGANSLDSMKGAKGSAYDATVKALAAYDQCRKELSAPRPTDSQLAEQASLSLARVYCFLNSGCGG